MIYKGYEAVIGLEVHCELSTASKIFCSCSTAYGGEANSHTCPVCTGMPGALPTLNRKVVEYAITAGLALNCTVNKSSGHDRKNYFYPDLPKGYQISQYDIPLLYDGHLNITDEDGQLLNIGIERIHIEEDAGKLIHRDGETLIDFNRAGVPLIEIVSRPCMHTAEEVKSYLRKLRTILVSTGVSDCKMNEGSMRADINVSVREVGDTSFTTRTEIKNLNSINHAGRAVEYEFKRQVDTILAGGEIVRETRRYDENSGKTFSMRSKEGQRDYRFFADPDLPRLTVSDELICSLAATLPELPDAKIARYCSEYSLSQDDAELIAESPAASEYYNTAVTLTQNKKTLTNLFIGEILPKLGENEPIVSPSHLAEITDLLSAGEINNGTAKLLISRCTAEDGMSPAEIVTRDNLGMIRDKEKIRELLDTAVKELPKAVSDYKNGKKAAIKSIIGRAMAISKGRADPVILNDEAEKIL
ncbi:MAG: Asp-tRNA(Asn)/Glu-tRNA(Gln) amidotransferase subunit GatB [Clostridia bacterium]|nr:Asp-tRNA(Asn)/Glu-tRNA(Gln) amidotransferase subunit GatB [Clostridia bacterium]